MNSFAPKPKQRPGVSLVELIFVMSLSSIVLGLVATSVRRVIDVDHRMKFSSEWITSAAQLSKQLRKDIRQSADAKIGEDESASGKRLSLTHDNRRIDYYVTKESIERTIHVDDEIVAREGYRIPSGSDVSWYVDGDPSKLRFVDLQIRNAKYPLPKKPLLLQVVTQLGRNAVNFEPEITDAP